MRILIIDDEAPTRRLLERHLLAHDAITSVVPAASAEEGAATAESQTFDVLIVDLVLDVQDGRQLLGPLHLAAPDALVVVLTALPAEAAETSSLVAGADLFLHKSVDLYPQLGDRLVEAVAQQRHR